MPKALTFIIPVRHPENASNWETVKVNISNTINSILNQDSKDWQAIIVANHGATLPEIPAGFVVVHVDFPPNKIFKKGSAPLEDVYNAVRIDKGRRILAGLLHARPQGHVMIVDDDDFISRRLTSFVTKNPNINGFYIDNGFVWGNGGRWLFHYDGKFSELCGTSHIVRADLYEVPTTAESASDEYIRIMLGSHRYIQEYLEERGTPLIPLPFIGAVYRTGGTENHSQSNDMLSEYFLQRWLWRKQPLKQIRRLGRLRKLGPKLINEFFGTPP